ncbi:GILT-like protein 1 isoform X2 [Macrosteles quadrilineatus]|uniref:GILT-like protein 1 isoform X2 n=1 Tax=Macrosteles quadrilineatus TaxID=74068 RepID=UPI0023E2AA2B|nr:GILT-like protein 1 isoform X2 [Macrosteles quadrilineatus]
MILSVNTVATSKMLAGVILLLCVAASSAFHAAVRDSKTVKVTVFYEAMDPVFKDFINNQFSPHWEQIEEGIEIELVPFGKTNVSVEQEPEPHLEFVCTRGEEECIANKLHACVIKKMHAHKLKMVKVIKCLINKKDQMDGLPDCLDEIHIRPDAHKFIDCVNSPDTDYLVVNHGIRTQKMFPKKLDSLPKIVFNDLFNKRDHAQALTNFKKLICRIVFDLCEEKNIRREITLQL